MLNGQLYGGERSAAVVVRLAPVAIPRITALTIIKYVTIGSRKVPIISINAAHAALGRNPPFPRMP